MITEVLASGAYNLIHAGHLQLFEFAARYGKLTVGLNTDKYLIEKYGSKAILLTQRAYVVAAIKYVDRVVAFSEPTPAELIRRLKPKYFIKGPDYEATKESLPELDAINEVGTKLIIQPAIKIYSSTELLSDSETGIDFEHTE